MLILNLILSHVKKLSYLHFSHYFTTKARGTKPSAPVPCPHLLPQSRNTEAVPDKRDTDTGNC